MIRLLCLFLVLALPAAARAPQWQMLPEDSFIRWTAEWQGNPAKGGFRDFSADIRFDTDDPDASSVTVTVSIASAYLQGVEARKTLTNENWFYEDKFPKAVFETKSIRHLDGDRYEAVADLRIRSVTKEVVLPFTLAIQDDLARMQGSLTLNRKAFNIGGGGGMADEVAPEVQVEVQMIARRR